jgi:predicted dienelactone hydrolase
MPRLPALALAAALSVALPVRSVPAAGRYDLAVLRVHTPRRTRLTDRVPLARARAAVTLQNRGSAPATIPDLATLAAVVGLHATASEGPIVCPAPVAVPRARRLPLVLAPGRKASIRFDLAIPCAPRAGQGTSWRFTATVDHAALDGHPDETPADDRCDRAPLGVLPLGTRTVRDRGCPLAATVLDDRRASTRFAVPGRYPVGSTTLALVDTTRLTMAHGAFPGAPERTLPTLVWYPAAGAGGPDAALATDGAPFPLVVFSHGLGSFNAQSKFLTEHLASHGYVVAAPNFPLSVGGAPGGPTVADIPAQAGDVHFLIDRFLAFSAAGGDRFAGGIDAERIALTGHSNGGATTLVAAYDRNLRDPRVKAAIPLAPASCWFQQGYFGTVDVPLLLLQGDHDLLVDAASHAEAVFARANAPKSLIVIHGGNHLGFADFGTTLDDVAGCLFLPDSASLGEQVAALLATLGGPADFVGVAGCATAFCAGDPAHLDGARQQQITKQAVAAFLAFTLRGDAAAERYLYDEMGPTNPDLTHQSVH